MLAAAALGALGAQLAGIRAAKEDWFVGAGRVDQEDVSLEADGAVTLRRQPPFDKALRNFPKMESPPKGKAERRLEVTDYETVMSHVAGPRPHAGATGQPGATPILRRNTQLGAPADFGH